MKPYYGEAFAGSSSKRLLLFWGIALLMIGSSVLSAPSTAPDATNTRIHNDGDHDDGAASLEDRDMAADDKLSDYYDDKDVNEDKIDDEDDVEFKAMGGNTNVKLISQGRTFEVAEGDLVELPCEISKSYDKQTAVRLWKQQPTRLLYQSHVAINPSTSMTESDSGALVINGVQKADEGTYTCEVASKGTMSINHILVVHRPAKIQYVQAENNVTLLKVGETLMLRCEATGDPKPTISWHKGEERLGSSAKGMETLVIERVKHRDAGEYRCLADNKWGKPDHKIINIHIERKPIVEIDKITVNSDHYHDTELKCTVHSEPAGQVVWQKDGQNIKNTQHTELSVHGHQHILLIRRVEENDFGAYTCLATNAIGETRKTVTIVKTPAVVGFVKPEKQIKDVVLAWKVESKTPITEHELQYRKDGDNDWIMVKPEVVSEEGGVYMVRYTLKGLEPGVYQTRIRSQNNHGWSDYSEMMPFEGVYAKHGFKHHKKGSKHSKDKLSEQDTLSDGTSLQNGDSIPNDLKHSVGASQTSKASTTAGKIAPAIHTTAALITVYFAMPRMLWCW